MAGYGRAEVEGLEPRSELVPESIGRDSALDALVIGILDDLIRKSSRFGVSFETVDKCEG